MADSRKIQVIMRYSGKEITQNYNYINPNATNAQLQSAVDGIMSLTNATYIDTDVIDTYSLSGATAQVQQQNNIVRR